MNALSLSHLTYCDRTTTVRSFHSLDHPPFPCTNNLSPRHIRVKRTRPDYVKDEHRRSPCGIASVHPMAALSLACTRTQSIFFCGCLTGVFRPLFTRSNRSANRTIVLLLSFGLGAAALLSAALDRFLFHPLDVPHPE